jgi:citronellol/citronellal dehydrogenase
MGQPDASSRRQLFAPDLLTGSTVLVFGAGGGLGAATARLAAQLGATVLLAGRTASKIEATHETIAKAGRNSRPQVVDIRDRASVDQLFGWAVLENLIPDIVINSAGGQFPQDAIDFSERGWRAVIDTNLNGTFNLMQASARLWRDTRRPGSIVNIVVEPRGLHGVAHTIAARSAVVAFSNAVAVEWAPLGIRVNCVAPGLVRTDGWRVYSEEARASYMHCNPQRTVGDAGEIAEACIYAGGPSSAYMTGNVITIDGGTRHWGEIWTNGTPAHFRKAGRGA